MKADVCSTMAIDIKTQFYYFVETFLGNVGWRSEGFFCARKCCYPTQLLAVKQSTDQNSTVREQKKTRSRAYAILWRFDGLKGKANWKNSEK